MHVHGPMVLGFGGFHGFDGQAHQNHENHQNPKPVVHVYTHTDGQAHQNHENLSICVHVHGPMVLGFGSHGFDGPVHLCVCVYMDLRFWVLVVFMVLMGLPICVCVCVHGPLVLGFGGFHGFDGPVHQNHENCQNPKPLVHLHSHR